MKRKVHFVNMHLIFGLTTFFTTHFCQEKELLRKKREEIEEAEQAKRNKVVMTFDLLGRKV